MFERFTHDARQTVVQAQAEAAALHHPRIGTEHLLLGLVGHEATPTSAVLARHGLTRATVLESVSSLVGDLDAEALTTLGIDLDAVRERVESTFGPGALDDPARRRGATAAGHIPFTPRAKKVMELSLREALALKPLHAEENGETSVVRNLARAVADSQTAETDLMVGMLTDRGGTPLPAP